MGFMVRFSIFVMFEFLFSLSFRKLMVFIPWTIPVQLFRMLILHEAFRTWMTTLRKTTVAEPTSREAMDMLADAVVDDLELFSLPPSFVG